jgi:hypothetical protein
MERLTAPELNLVEYLWGYRETTSCPTSALTTSVSSASGPRGFANAWADALSGDGFLGASGSVSPLAILYKGQ